MKRIRHTDRVVVALLLRAGRRLRPAPAREGRAQWVDWFRAPDRVRYLMLDCLRPVLDALGLDEHKDAGRLLVAIDALLQAADIPEAAIVHHMGHVGERSRGDSRLIDWPDVTAKLVRQDDNPASPRYISAYGRDVDMPESRLEYDPLTRRLTVVGGPRATMPGWTASWMPLWRCSKASASPLSGRSKVKEALVRTPSTAAMPSTRRSRPVLRKVAGSLVDTGAEKRPKLDRASRSVPVVSQGQSAERVFECPSPL